MTSLSTRQTLAVFCRTCKRSNIYFLRPFFNFTTLWIILRLKFTSVQMKRKHQIGAEQIIKSKEVNMLSKLVQLVDTFKVENISVLAPITTRENPIIIMAMYGNMIEKNVFMNFSVACSLIRAFCLKQCCIPTNPLDRVLSLKTPTHRFRTERFVQFNEPTLLGPKY